MKELLASQNQKILNTKGMALKSVTEKHRFCLLGFSVKSMGAGGRRIVVEYFNLGDLCKRNSNTGKSCTAQKDCGVSISIDI